MLGDSRSSKTSDFAKDATYSSKHVHKTGIPRRKRWKVTVQGIGIPVVFFEFKIWIDNRQSIIEYFGRTKKDKWVYFGD